MDDASDGKTASLREQFEGFGGDSDTVPSNAAADKGTTPGGSGSGDLDDLLNEFGAPAPEKGKTPSPTPKPFGKPELNQAANLIASTLERRMNTTPKPIEPPPKKIAPSGQHSNIASTPWPLLEHASPVLMRVCLRLYYSVAMVMTCVTHSSFIENT